ncbi:MAG: DUF262 domain-containing protein [Rikenellaceae bacterium]
MEDKYFETNDELLQLAENINVDIAEGSPTAEEKREMLKKTRIVKQTWSIYEIFQKIKDQKLNLSPSYQRNEIWGKDKQTAFVESLLMGIIIPPIYVVETPGQSILDGSTYEVVDGKQRLTTINSFLKNELTLTARLLEYYGDLFGGKNFSEISEINQELTSELLSSVLDIYVITANSPEFTKYDIFARLNKGAEKLKVNEIRKAVYRSSILNIVDEYIKSKTADSDSDIAKEYSSVFTANAQKRYDDYGRFYRSMAFYIRSKYSGEKIEVEKYNSRPREMINGVLQDLQNNKINISEDIQNILESTLELLLTFTAKEVETKNIDYIIDACIPFIKTHKDTLFSKLDEIIADERILLTLDKSLSTTSNVNDRLKRVKEIVIDNE